MKNRFYLLAMIAIAFTACSKEAKTLSGDYSYKKTGSIQIATDTTSITLHLNNEIGQLNIIDLNAEEGNKVMLVYNTMNGDIITTNATITGDTLKIDPYNRQLSIQTDSISGKFDIEVRGYGVRYDNLILFNEIYEGEIEENQNKATVYGDDIKTIAERN